MEQTIGKRVACVADKALDWMLQRFDHQQDTPLGAKELNDMMGALEKVQRIAGSQQTGNMQIFSMIPRPATQSTQEGEV